jgi:hypothetical protein
LGPLAGSEPDFVDALAVVLDMYIKADQARVLGKSVTKKVVLISNFKAQVGPAGRCLHSVQQP